jgi:hypothetical protein
MRIRTLLLFLVGSRRAILDLVAEPRVLGIGALFVLSAGFARDYDGKDLVHEPWHLLLPYGASLLTSFILFSLFFGIGRLRGWSGAGFWSSYRSFLSLFWMTAPLAWLYAIPYERFLTPLGALEANLWTLGLVAGWRVVLIIRVASVLTGASIVASTFLVMLVADAEALIALYYTPLPIIRVMGGVRYSPSEQLLLDTAIAVGVLAVLSLPIWLIGTATVCSSNHSWKVPNPEQGAATPSGRGLFYLACASVAIWALFLPSTQQEQLLRSEVERDFKEGRIASALATMSAHAPGDFPPQWEPPPRLAYGARTPNVLEVMEEIVRHSVAPWVHEIYVQRFDQYLDELFNYYPQDVDQLYSRWLRAADVLHHLPEGRALVAEHRGQIERCINRASPDSSSLLGKLTALLKEEKHDAKDSP